uniref:Uncharacterized protein n=1 Tax=Cacopsylla melanoneura TaxID=428564 RepID=A0A8D9BP74_9HEMI
MFCSVESVLVMWIFHLKVPRDGRIRQEFGPLKSKSNLKSNLAFLLSCLLSGRVRSVVVSWFLLSKISAKGTASAEFCPSFHISIVIIRPCLFCKTQIVFTFVIVEILTYTQFFTFLDEYYSSVDSI